MGLSMSFFALMYLYFLLFFFQLTSSRQPLCHDNERIALLGFKESFVINKSASGYPSAYPKAARWNLEENSDCCSWDGVKCNEDTGYVIKLDLTSSYLYGSLNSASNILFNLVHLQWLSLADNHFNESKIPYGIKNLSTLSYLNLSFSVFSGQIPLEILELSNLQSLDLSQNGLQLHQPDLKSLTEKLTNLKVLDLGSVNFSSSLPQALTNLSSLKFLSLRGCNLQGTINSISNLNCLTHLDLSNNKLQETIHSISNLNNLTHLDLSYNHLQGTIYSISKLNSLTHLDLASNYLQGKIPSSLGNLTNLAYLDMSQNRFSNQDPPSLTNLSHLNYLDLSSNNFSNPSSSLSWINNHTELTYLCLSNISISEIPVGLWNMNQLSTLILSYNQISGPIPPQIGNLTKLSKLYLSLNQLQGSIPSSIFKLNNLEVLDLSSNNLSDTIEFKMFLRLKSLSRLYLSSNRLSLLTNSTVDISSYQFHYFTLKNLDLSSNQLQGSIPSFIFELNNLEELDLSSNNLSGTMDFKMFLRLKSLSRLDLSSNRLSLPTDSTVNASFYQVHYFTLKNLDLSSNQLQGSIPNFIFELNNLEELDLSSNNLSGIIEFEMFLRLKNLSMLDLSSNRLSLLTNSTVNASLSKFYYLSLSSCNLRGFPDFLRNQDKLQWLDLSFNNITGQIPVWLLNISQDSLQFLNLSHNLLIGFEQQPVILSWAQLIYLDLSFNNLQDPLPIPPTSTIKAYILSHNKMSGELQPWICKLNSLSYLDLSDNNLSGKLPQCLGNFSQSMLMLNLQNNKFCGLIPQTFMNGTNLRMIDLSNNILQGKLPRSLTNCIELEVLDLGNNKISDTFPSWIGTLPYLKVLNLQSNQLYGEIEEPKSDFAFPKLQVIDLSQNRFMGKLPSKYFESWNTMKIVNTSQLVYIMKAYTDGNRYDYSIRIVNKGLVIEYEKISNTLVSICLSNNKFEGEIPASISTLKGLRYLNLSKNNFVGGIPSSLGNLTVLESLDLSYNNLQGEIPQILVKLTPLAFFDVSHNNLTGIIPQGAQFDTFSSGSYEGNSWLCGQPLSKKCGNSELPQKEDDQELESPFAFGWKEVAIGYANGLIFGVVLGYIFCTKKYDWFVKIFGMPLKEVERNERRHRN